jgi:hypothetical protein
MPRRRRPGSWDDIVHEVQRYSGSAQWDDLTLVVAKGRIGAEEQRGHTSTQSVEWAR